MKNAIREYIKVRRDAYLLSIACKKKPQTYPPTKVQEIANLVNRYNTVCKNKMDALTCNLIVCVVSMYYCHPESIVQANTRDVTLVKQLCYITKRSIGTIRRYKNIIPTLYWNDKKFRQIADDYIDYVGKNISS